ncbi:MAG: hypothetical protein SFU25_01505 [Candidatus Caenarcaniphilales bacterium]|nr:hypothetical protein [Candidatus Caenarcaniphilales bacterium]
MVHKQIPAEALINLRHRLESLPSRCQERRILIEETAALYGVSTDTLYRALRNSSRPKSINRSDSGTPRKLSLSDMERYCEVIAAMKIRTSNKKGRHISTVRAIELLEEFGMETPNGFVQPPKGALTRSTVSRPKSFVIAQKIGPMWTLSRSENVLSNTFSDRLVANPYIRKVNQ